MCDATEKEHLRQSPAAIFLVALALRLVAVRLFYNSAWNDYEDHLRFGFETGRVSRSIAEGHGFGNPLLVHTSPTAWLTPVYPYLLAGVFKLFGVYTKTSALVILSLNALFSALICLPVYRLARCSLAAASLSQPAGSARSIPISFTSLAASFGTPVSVPSSPRFSSSAP